MCSLKVLLLRVAIFYLFTWETLGKGYYSNSYLKYDYTPPKVYPHPNYAELAKIDRKYAACGQYVPDIRELTIRDIQTLYFQRKLSSVLLTSCYLIRIKYMNPFLHAVIEVNPDAVRDALRSDYEKYLGYRDNHREDLHGIPMLIKDNIGTRDTTQTCSGSLALVGYKPLFEASVATLLKKAGVIIIGKTNLSEFASFRGTNVPNGWSGRGNQTQNCYFLHVEPWGSSTGSAVAVASNLCAAALGTETDGSIVTPSDSACLVGLKPSLGCVPTDAVIPLSFSQDVVGPMARSADDAAIIFKVIANSHCTSYLNTKNNNEYQHKRIQIGIIRNPFWTANVSDADQVQSIDILNRVLEKCKNSNFFKLIDPIVVRNGIFKKIFRQTAEDKEFITFLHEFKIGMNDYLSKTRFEYKSNYEYEADDINTKFDNYVAKILLPHVSQRPPTLKDVIEFNDKHPLWEGYNQDILKLAEATDGIRNQTYLNARNSNIETMRGTLNCLFDEYKLDAIAAPGISAGVDGDGLLHSYFAMAGYPYIIVPAHCRETKPLGITFHGRMYSDAKLLQIAKVFESCAQARNPPSFLQ